MFVVVLALVLSFGTSMPVSTSIGTWSDLKVRLGAPSKGGTVVLDTPFDMDISDAIIVDAPDITIVGNGAVFDAGGKHNFFQMYLNTNFAIENVTMQNSGGNQAAMYIIGGAVILKSCVFSGNTGVQGGAVLVENANIDFILCTFSGNSVKGSVAAGGAVCIHLQSTASFTACTFAANTATTNTGPPEMNGGGGAIGIGVDGCHPSIVLKGCTFIAGTKGPGHNDIARFFVTGPSPVLFLCGDGFVGAPVQWNGNQTSVIPPVSLKCTPAQREIKGTQRP
jgi:hypothetical protein